MRNNSNLKDNPLLLPLRQWPWWSLLLGTLVGVAACYTPREGCLDIEATNYDVSADDPCPDCCEYPSLQIRFNHELVYPDTVLRLRYDSAYAAPGNPDHLFRFKRIQFYLKDFVFQYAGGTKSVTREIDLRLPSGGGDTTLQAVTDDFVVVDRDFLGGRNLGSFRLSETLTALSFSAGLSEEVRQADPFVLPGSHPLALQEDSLNWDPLTGLIGFQMELQADTLSSQLLQVEVEEEIPVQLQLVPGLAVEPGFDVVVTLSIDYLQLLAGLNLETVTEAELEAAIVSQLPNAFYSLEIAFE